MKKIGFLFGMENSFPPAVVDEINGMNVDGVTAEFVNIGGIRMDEPKNTTSSSIAFRRTSSSIARI